MSVSLLVGLLLYWNWANIGISPVPDEIFFWNFLETFIGCFYTSSKWFWISCMSVSLFAYFLTTIIPSYISSSGLEIFLDFLETFLRYWYPEFFVCLVSLVVGILPWWNQTNLGILPALDEISYWIFMDTFLGCWYTCSK